MKGVTMKLFAALLALTLSLAGCGPVDGDPIRPAPGSAGPGSSTAASGAEDTEPEQLAALRQLAAKDGELAGVLYLGSVPERTTDVKHSHRDTYRMYIPLSYFLFGMSIYNLLFL